MEEDSNQSGFLFITANVGSLFEESCEIHEIWMEQFVNAVKKAGPSFVALHMQEIGGKDFVTCMSQVQDFIKDVYAKCAPLGFSCGRAFLDQNFEIADQFTALGSLYLIHSRILPSTEIWDDRLCKFNKLDGFKIFGDLTSEPVGTAYRVRFPRDFFENTKFSRKGFLKTRWRVKELVLDLVNVHLFHDACNITAMESPAVFATMRRQGLRFVLQSLLATHKDNSTSDPPPMFIFGDFNFRLDNKALVRAITIDAPEIERIGEANSVADLTPNQPHLTVVFKKKIPQERGYVLQIKKKGFDYEHHDEFLTDWKSLLDHNLETNHFPQLHEFPIHFPPR